MRECPPLRHREGARTVAPGIARRAAFVGLINDILDLSKIEAGKMDLTLETVTIQPVVEEVFGTARALAEQN
jgi:signal transduction histidine kinase